MVALKSGWYRLVISHELLKIIKGLIVENETFLQAKLWPVP